MTLEKRRIERAAEAVYREFEKRPLYAQAQINCIIADELARAAISAYLGDDSVVVPREPTQEMLDVALSLDSISRGVLIPAGPADVWTAMISAATPQAQGG